MAARLLLPFRQLRLGTLVFDAVAAVPAGAVQVDGKGVGWPACAFMLCVFAGRMLSAAAMATRQGLLASRRFRAQLSASHLPEGSDTIVNVRPVEGGALLEFASGLAAEVDFRWAAHQCGCPRCIQANRYTPPP
jgi:hypothetical protein